MFKTWTFFGLRFQIHILPRFKVRLYFDSGKYWRKNE
ncbi:hypothetical protein EVB32_044 [Rhizobium phage RHph_TM39]|uniref:Uncharacterized protein n=1 Tax=Rhizobium phage RHph_TM30 TaxID=2509764 RepID=A0A7S5UW81_9CAUD|nr:hypothetical protein PQC16_gp044 [Rhizobium phage RHph_TM30]QIG71515.1 hypothetical protein EVB94_044 [Rhizobium phage RHph_TM40]QIG71878.1 hypothetical protein EVB95_044 [Rhizobium phage RHph_TM2_3B]QIG72240.1 hypothetical protein EVB96_044 [Rhizobium phage RHph_TM3_3_6]QIG77032.1 hypothetical protein EVB32_044 [Rhizobium phage RHph_TM39]QIG77372.1 hypothetical protein EVB61_044 [Rhizobium phage RHph_TM21B]QIG77631.1 hypothetical protein EVB64_044 [Rhizobium phage RHph_TM61]